MTSLAHKKGGLAESGANVSQSLRVNKEDRSVSEHREITTREVHSESITEGTKLSLNPSSVASLTDQNVFRSSTKEPDYKLVVRHGAN
jgi:hypothetical protein